MRSVLLLGVLSLFGAMALAQNAPQNSQADTLQDVACEAAGATTKNVQNCIAISSFNNIYLHTLDLKTPSNSKYRMLFKFTNNDGSVQYMDYKVNLTSNPNVSTETVVYITISADPTTAAVGTTFTVSAGTDYTYSMTVSTAASSIVNQQQ